MRILSWGEFKEAVENEGITDSDRIFFIDTGSLPSGVSATISKDGLIVQGD